MMNPIKYATFKTSVEFEQWQGYYPDNEIFQISPILKTADVKMSTDINTKAEITYGVFVTYKKQDKNNEEKQK